MSMSKKAFALAGAAACLALWAGLPSAQAQTYPMDRDALYEGAKKEGTLVWYEGAPLQAIIVSVQVLAGIMLPSAIIFLQLLLNDHELLGDRWVNRPWNNVINWTIIVILFALSLLLAAQVMLPNLFN